MRRSQRQIAWLLVLALLVGVMSAGVPFVRTATDTLDSFAGAYTALLKKAPTVQADLQQEPYGLCRLIVTDYKGESYGAVACAVTEDLAILQYGTPSAAEKAAVQLRRDGATAEADGVCRLEAAEELTGNLCPWAGEMVGTTAFLQRCQIPLQQVVVAQIDTGIMAEHPALKGRLVSAGMDVSGDGCADARYDTRQRGATYWHATAVASILAGNTGKNVKILPYKVVQFGKDTCTASAILAAMADAISKGVRVLNMSLSVSHNKAGFAAMMERAAANQVAVCCSAGNDGAWIQERYPSVFPQAITVSAVTESKTAAGFSNYGDTVDFCAPGSHVTVATMDSSGQPVATTASGTSLSSPYGAACCALLLGMQPDLTLDQLCALLQAGAEDLGDAGFDPIYGYGLLRVDTLKTVGAMGDLTYTFTLPEGTLAVNGAGNGPDFDSPGAVPWALWQKALQQVTVGAAVMGIGKYTFSGCQNAAFSLPDTLQSVGAYAFQDCSAFTQISLPATVERIGAGAFSGCSALTVRGWRNTPAAGAAAAAGVAFVPLGCVHNYVCRLVSPTDTDAGRMIYTCAVCGDTYTRPYAQPEIVDSGTCGKGVTWTCYATGQLEIGGSGRMSAYTNGAAPWAAYADRVNSVLIGEQVTGVSAYAFANMRRVTAFAVAGTQYKADEGVLYTADGTELICYPGGRAALEFTIPQGVKTVYASAFLSAWQLQQISNASSALTVTEEGLLYSKNGHTLMMALPQFCSETLVLRQPQILTAGAFLLNHTLHTLYAVASVSVEPNGLGVCFASGFVPQALTVYGLPGSGLQSYCGSSIPFYPVNSGVCGDRTAWQFDVNTEVLTLSGNGAVADFAAGAAPWALFADRVRQVVAEDGVTELPPNCFADCAALTQVVLGDDVVQINGNWFAHCPKLTQLTVKAPEAEFPQTALTGHRTGLTIAGYYDTTAMDYAAAQQLTFVALGCLHRAVQETGDAPTCVAGAVHRRTCARCGADLGTVELPPIGHQYQETVLTPAGCTTGGRSEYTCTVCGAQYTADTPATGHQWETVDYIAPGCCTGGSRTRRCAHCHLEQREVYGPTEPGGHYVKGTVQDKAGAPLANITVALDGKPVAVTGENGVFLFEGVRCGVYTLTFSGGDCVQRSVPLTVSGGNTTASDTILLLAGDRNGDGYVNARDYVLAQRQGLTQSSGADLSLNQVLPGVSVDRLYGVQAQIGVLYVQQQADPAGSYRRQFEVNVRAFNEYRVVACGFLYGKDMTEADLVPERVGTQNAQGNPVRRAAAACTSGRKVLRYGAASGTGTVSARFYITYTNGVMTKTYLSEVCTYDYDQA